MTPDPIQRLTAELAKLPGIGEKTAQRLAFHILRAKPGYARELATAIVDVVEKVRLCSICCTLTEADPCSLCSDGRRDDRVVCVVENVPDLRDVTTMVKMLDILGAVTTRKDGVLTIDTTNANGIEAPYDLVRTMRASIYVLAPTLAVHGRARVSR